ncbi:MerR family transcriptional regulator [Actinoplanes sp. L3-i22]|uniref:MerR family transcriptional regulator n=1 Tax=Actinoplanes sp. L3-i22 TaxID=2836373 RepID=UPI001C75A947|nr:MerR family transcriptional regulator [Actinoplanes sp. L3-i22]BCY08159.1 MerR family transcriptional regulator [Actinoplanes sp. L3-i22]
MAALLTVGEFAQLTHLSIRTLRRYHDSGLLTPARVDEATGYRYYDAGQIPAAQVIHRLRELDLPLAEVRQVLATPDQEERAGLIAAHLRRLEDQLERTRAAVASLRQLLRPPATDLPVRVHRVGETTVAGIGAEVVLGDVLAWYAGAMAELDAVVVEPAGPPGGSYDNELFTDGRGHALVYLPSAAPPSTGRVRPVVLPAAELAVATHAGDHDTIDVTYGRLGRWVAEHSLAVGGPVREHYLCGPRDTADAASWRTEIAWPVFAAAPQASPTPGSGM